MAKRNFSRGSIDQMIDAFENKIAELGGQPDIVDSCDAITAAYRDDVIEDEDGEMLEEDVAVEGDDYIQSLVAAVDAQLESSNHLDSWTWEYDQDKENIHLTTVSDEDILEYTIPMSDLSQTDEGVETDVDYIMAAVMGEEDNEDMELDEEEDVLSSTVLEDDEEDIVIECAGEYDKWEELMTKQVPDADGFYTDYTLYHNPFTNEYICMFGDKDIYRPETDPADWSSENEEEAIEWFNSYDGLVEEDEYVESSENIEGAFGDKKKQQIKEIMEQAFGDYRWQTPEVVARGVANQIRSALVEIGQVCTSESWVRIGKKLTKLPKEIESRKPSLQSIIREMIKIAENADGADVDTDALEDIRNRLSKLERSGSLGEKIVKQIDKQSWQSIPSVMRDAMKQAFRDFNGDYRNDM